MTYLYWTTPRTHLPHQWTRPHTGNHKNKQKHKNFIWNQSMVRTGAPPTVIDRLKRQRAYAWSKYYKELEKNHDQQIQILGLLSMIRQNAIYFGGMHSTSGSSIDPIDIDAPARAPDALPEMPNHLTTEFEDMLEKLKKSVECPVCLESIGKGKLKITGCGHKYCEACFAKIDKCAVCRRKIKK